MQCNVPKFGGPWPTARQELLLQAALGRGASAREALARWEPGFDPERIDHETLTLLPLLYRNLESDETPSRFTEKYRSVYRWSWCRNQLLFDAARQALLRLHEAGVRTMLLKGAALGRVAYGEDGVRPMGDCDVLVPTDQVDTAARILENAGFAPVLALGPRLIRTRHSAPFRDALGREIDLHWHVLAEDIGPGADDDFWTESQPIEWEGVHTRMLCPADHLLLITAHGARGGLNTSPVYWIADAVLLLRRTADTMAWSRLLDQARGRTLTLTLRRALDYLADTFGAPVPAGVRAALARHPISIDERLEYWLKVRNAARSALGNLPRYWFAYTRLCHRLGRRPEGIAFLSFVKEHRLVNTWVFVGRAFLWPVRQAAWLTTGLFRSSVVRAREAPPPIAPSVGAELRGGE